MIKNFDTNAPSFKAIQIEDDETISEQKKSSTNIKWNKTKKEKLNFSEIENLEINKNNNKIENLEINKNNNKIENFEVNKNNNKIDNFEVNKNEKIDLTNNNNIEIVTEPKPEKIVKISKIIEHAPEKTYDSVNFGVSQDDINIKNLQTNPSRKQFDSVEKKPKNPLQFGTQFQKTQPEIPQPSIQIKRFHSNNNPLFKKIDVEKNQKNNLLLEKDRKTQIQEEKVEERKNNIQKTQVCEWTPDK